MFCNDAQKGVLGKSSVHVSHACSIEMYTRGRKDVEICHMDLDDYSVIIHKERKK